MSDTIVVQSTRRFECAPAGSVAVEPCACGAGRWGLTATPRPKRSADMALSLSLSILVEPLPQTGWHGPSVRHVSTPVRCLSGPNTCPGHDDAGTSPIIGQMPDFAIVSGMG